MFAERDRGRRYVLVAEKAGQCGLPKDRLEPGGERTSGGFAGDMGGMRRESCIAARLPPGGVLSCGGCGQGRQLLSGQVRSLAALQPRSVGEDPAAALCAGAGVPEPRVQQTGTAGRGGLFDAKTVKPC